MDSQVTELLRCIVQRLDKIEQQQELIQRRQSKLDLVVEQLDSVHYFLDRQYRKQNLINVKIDNTKDMLEQVAAGFKRHFKDNQTDHLSSVTDGRLLEVSDDGSSQSSLQVEDAVTVSDNKDDETKQKEEIRENISSKPQNINSLSVEARFDSASKPENLNLHTAEENESSISELQLTSLQNVEMKDKAVSVHEDLQSDVHNALNSIEDQIKELKDYVLDVHRMLEDKTPRDFALAEDGIKRHLEDISYKMTEEIISRSGPSLNRVMSHIKQEVESAVTVLRIDFNDSIRKAMRNSASTVKDHITDTKNTILGFTKREIQQLQIRIEYVLFSMANMPNAMMI